jgi:hypothetical protein
MLDWILHDHSRWLPTYLRYGLPTTATFCFSFIPAFFAIHHTRLRTYPQIDTWYSYYPFFVDVFMRAVPGDTYDVTGGTLLPKK